MADFVQTMKDWRRMCKKNHTDCMRFCPICANPTCGELEEADDEDIRKAEAAIMAWAAEHPEPVYPTWFEWFKTVVPDEEMLQRGMYWDMQIPADIASKLGIQPKEAKE